MANLDMKAGTVGVSALILDKCWRQVVLLTDPMPSTTLRTYLTLMSTRRHVCHAVNLRWRFSPFAKLLCAATDGIHVYDDKSKK